MSVNGCTIAPIQCPKCESTCYRKSGKQKGRQRYLCKNCGKQFLEPPPAMGMPSAEPPETNGSQTQVAAITVDANCLNLPLANEVKNGDSPLASEVSSASEIALKLPDSPPLIEPNPPVSPLPASGIGILLLDVENLKIDLKTEQFLASLCSSPLQVKIAFANWKNPSLGNQDTELHKRGYQLVHVPSGSNNADGKMIAVGSSIFLHYPTAKEIFVCSSDTLLIHLCNELQSQGLRVYRVWRQEKTLAVEMYHTGKVKYYSLAIGAEIPDFQDLMNQLKQWVSTEQNSLNDRLANLALISTLFQARSQIVYQENCSNYLPETPENLPTDPSVFEQEIARTTAAAFASTLAAEKINSKQELENALREMMKSLEIKLEADQISVGDLGVGFTQKYGKSPSSILKELGISGNLTEFLKSSPGFKVTGANGQFRVASTYPP